MDLDVQGTKVTLKPGQYSDWIPLTFSFNFLVKAKGMIQLLVLDADKELKIYGSPVNFDPRDPPIPISKPDGFSAELAKKIGLYRTIGWAEATWPLNEDRIDEATFLADCERAFDDRERIILKNLERDDWDLFVAAIETTDRVSHMMWRLIDPKHPMYRKELADKYGDAIEKVYRRADDFVGRLRAKVPKDAVFMVMSDHGFHSFRRGVNLNTWLTQNGYMTFEGQVGETEGPRRPLRPRRVLRRASTGRRPGPTRWAWARSTSTSRAARARASSPRGPSTRRCRTRSAASS